jgi:hypothetical protein
MPIVTTAGDRSSIRPTDIEPVIALGATSGRELGPDTDVVSLSVVAYCKLPTGFKAAEHALEGFPALVEDLPDAAFPLPGALRDVGTTT